MMMTWTPPATWTAAALAAAWARGIVVGDGRVDGGLTIIAMVCAIAAALCVLDLASGRHMKRG